MIKIKYGCLIPVITGVLLLNFSACQTSNAFKVPGESKIITKNISSEYFTIADGYMDLKKYDKATEYYKLAMKNKELRLSAYYKLARCYVFSGDYSKAKEAYETLLKFDPENKDLQLSVAYVNGMSGNVDKAREQYEDLKEKYPDDSVILENYISLLIFQKNLDTARENLNVLKEKFPDSSKIKDFEEKIAEPASKEPQEAVPDPALDQNTAESVTN